MELHATFEIAVNYSAQSTDPSSRPPGSVFYDRFTIQELFRDLFSISAIKLLILEMELFIWVSNLFVEKLFNSYSYFFFLLIGILIRTKGDEE